ncbi:type II secretion system F family protein [Synechococcus sp. GreenBA-s]|nr:type II secretion system F family protein [Synechococcus sp. GreenBA-s]
MPTFTATYTARGGQRRELRVSAADVASAKRDLRRRGIVPVSLVASDAKSGGAGAGGRPAGSKPSLLKMDLGSFFEAKPGVKEKAIFANKMAALVDAGVPIVRGLDLMANQQRLPMFKRALTAISSEVNQGGSLGAAMRRWPKVFDRLSIAMVEAGETGGVLDETLHRLSILMEDVAKLQNQIKGAMGYPIAILVIAVSVFLGMTIFIIPQFAAIFKSLNAELPIFTQLLVDLSGLLRSSFSIFLVAGIFAIVWLFGRYYSTPQGKLTVDRNLLKVPLFGDLLQKSSTAQFCRIYSALSRAGVPILLALDIVKETSGNAAIQLALEQARTEVQEGVNLSGALSTKKVFPDLALSMLTIGEETGEMDKMLSKVADFYEDEVSTTVKNLTSMLEPAMIVFVGGMVGALLVAMYLPMFSVFDKIR